MVIPVRMINSFQICEIPIPFIITPLTIIMYHFAGTKFESTCKIMGMLVIGKAYPLNITTGSIKPNKEINIAACCVSVIVEISIPKDRAQKM